MGSTTKRAADPLRRGRDQAPSRCARQGDALLAEAGAFTASKCWSGSAGAYDSWTAIAALDFLIEREELMCIMLDSARQDKI